MTTALTPRYRVQNIPDELKALDRWCVFHVVRLSNDKLKKTPLIAGVRPIPGARIKAESNDPTTWRSFDEAHADAEVRGLYLGCAFDRDLGMTFIDRDDAIGPDGSLTPDTQLLIDTLDSYTEVSVSGTGLHVVTRGLVPARFTKNGFAGPVEVYPKCGAQFMLVTGDTRPGLGSGVTGSRSGARS